MYSDIPFLVAALFIGVGLWALTWSANRFVDASGSLANNLGVPPFIIGMVVIGFGTSAPELAVSAISAYSGHSEIALGNAWGSNIYNIAVILKVEQKDSKSSSLYLPYKFFESVQQLAYLFSRIQIN